MSTLTIAEIKRLTDSADEKQLHALQKSLDGDPRVGVQKLLCSAQARIDAQRAEQSRLDGMYSFQKKLAEQNGAKIVVGLDEVGRGPLAGPLCVGAVVLAEHPRIAGLNDSKQVPEKDRKGIADCIRSTAIAWDIEFVDPHDIDEHGMTNSLRLAFSKAVRAIELQGVTPDLIMLDGNPLHFDKREISIVKGDAQCASIAAASIIAKVARDELMISLDSKYPQYGFAKNKGYGTSEHREAIHHYGLTEIHRVSFCS